MTGTNGQPQVGKKWPELPHPDGHMEPLIVSRPRATIWGKSVATVMSVPAMPALRGALSEPSSRSSHAEAAAVIQVVFPERTIAGAGSRVTISVAGVDGFRLRSSRQYVARATDVWAVTGISSQASVKPSPCVAAAMEGAMAKLFSSQVAERVTSVAVDIFGGNGYTREYPVEKFWRDSKIGKIYEGTSNMQLATIAKTILTDRL